MKKLSRDDILLANDLTDEDVQVPEWGGVVTVRTMTGTQRDAMSAALAGGDGKADMSKFRSVVLAHTLVGEDGAPLFQAADVDALVAKLDADCFTELVDRSTLAGRMTVALFRLLDESFTNHLQAREIQALPEHGKRSWTRTN